MLIMCSIEVRVIIYHFYLAKLAEFLTRNTSKFLRRINEQCIKKKEISYIKMIFTSVQRNNLCNNTL